MTTIDALAIGAAGGFAFAYLTLAAVLVLAVRTSPGGRRPPCTNCHKAQQARAAAQQRRLDAQRAAAAAARQFTIRAQTAPDQAVTNLHDNLFATTPRVGRRKN